MENSLNRDSAYDYNYDAGQSRRPRPEGDNDTAAIRFLLQGAESMILRPRLLGQYPEHYRDEHSHFPRDREREGRSPSSSSSFIGLFPFVFKISMYGTLAILLMLVSLGEFGIFYNLVMPRLHSSDTLHFDYTDRGLEKFIPSQVPPGAVPAAVNADTANRTCTANDWTNPPGNDHSDVVCNTDNSTTTDKDSSSPPTFPLHQLQREDHYEPSRRSMQSAPVAVVDLLSNHDSWQHYHPDVVPPPKQEEHILTKGAPHYIEVLLDLPESEINRNKIGVFSVVVDLYSSSSSPPDEADDDESSNTPATTTTTKTLLASSTRAARIPHESHWISVVRKFLCILPHVLGAIPESRRVTVQSFRFFVESEELALRYVTVHLVVSRENRKRGERVEVGQGILHIGEELRGLQLVLKEWFFTCMAIGTTVLFVLQLFLALTLRSLLEYRSHRRREQERERIILEDDVSEGLGLDGLDDDDVVVDDNGDGGGAREASSTGNADDARSSRDEQRSTHNTSSYEIDDEAGQWEDLPTTAPGSRTTQSNNGNDENASGTTRGEPEPFAEETPHTIPNE